MIALNISGQLHNTDVPADMPLVWVLRDVLAPTGTKSGCGIAVRRMHSPSGWGARALLPTAGGIDWRASSHDHRRNRVHRHGGASAKGVA